MKISESIIGQLEDGAVRQFVLTHPSGAQVTIINFGAAITGVLLPDRQGELAQIAMGFPQWETYVQHRPYTGVVCGRVANRIRHGQLVLEGRTYAINRNFGAHTLHGGWKGFDQVLWTVQERIEQPNQVGVRLAYWSPSGEEGFPGNLKVELVYRFNAAMELDLVYRAETDQLTAVNLTNHSYFNLNGFTGPIYDHHLQIRANHLTLVDADLLPTGAFGGVAGTPYDFLDLQEIGPQLQQTPQAEGYDINYVLDHQPGAPDCYLYHPPSGRWLSMVTTEPGVQIYTANHFDGSLFGHRGVAYQRHAGLALEAQRFPDATHHPHFPSIALYPGELYQQMTTYQFGVEPAS